MSGKYFSKGREEWGSKLLKSSNKDQSKDRVFKLEKFLFQMVSEMLASATKQFSPCLGQ